MKKPAALWKAEALCCLCLVLLLPVTATEKWCKNPDNFKWMTETLQKAINELNENLLPSMVKYDVFSRVDTAELTDRCFIIVTAQQLNNTLLRLMSYFGTNSGNHKQTERIVEYLTKIYDECSDTNPHRCLKPDTKIVTACRSDLFAYFQAVLNHYIYIFDQCRPEDRTTGHSEINFFKVSTTTSSSDCCLIDLHSGSHPDNVHGNTSAQPSYNASAPQPSSSLMPPVQTVVGHELSSTTGITSTATSVVTEDNNGSAATNKSALFGSISTDDPHHSDGNLTQREFSNSGTMPDTLSTPNSAASHSQTVCAPIGAAGTASPHEDKQHTYCQQYLYPFIATLTILFLVLCVSLYRCFKTMRMKRRYWGDEPHVNFEADPRRGFLETQI